MTVPTRFRTIPLQDELQTVERDLRFRPSEVTSPSRLTPAEVEHFNRTGYLKGIRIFTSEEIDAHRREFDALLERVLASGGSSYSISTAHLAHGMVWDLLTHPRIVACVKDLLGDQVVGWGSHYFCKMPGDGKKVHWHQDASYWPLTPAHAVTVWLAIDDADRENGCMKYLAGSHLDGHLTYRLTEDDPDAVLNQEVVGVDRYGEPVDVALRAGEVSIHSDLLLHASEPNESNRRRCGLTLRYCHAEVHAGLGWSEKGVWLGSGAAPAHWSDQPRPRDGESS